MTTLSDPEDLQDSDPSTKEDLSQESGSHSGSWNPDDQLLEDDDLQQPVIHIDRPALKQEEFHKLYGLDEGQNRKSYSNGMASIGRSIKRKIRTMQTTTCMSFLMSWIPILVSFNFTIFFLSLGSFQLFNYNCY